MAGELNQISLAIGALQADGEQARRHRDAIWKKLEGIEEKLGPLAVLANDVALMKPAVDDWRMTKQRALGILALLSLLFTLLGFMAQFVITWIVKRVNV